MNKLFFFATLFTFLLASCSKDESTPAAEKVAMSYKVNGTLVELKGTSGNTSALVAATGSVVIFGVQQGGNGLTLVLSNNTVGKYILGDSFGDNHATYQSLANAFSTEKANDGTLEITASSSTNLKGTFKFTGYDADGKKAEITEGKFDIPVTK
jgi:hypothetical protein